MATFEEALKALLDGKEIEVNGYRYEEITDLHALTSSEVQSDSWEVRGYWVNCSFEEAMKHLIDMDGPIRSVDSCEEEVDVYERVGDLYKICSSEIEEQWQRKYT